MSHPHTWREANPLNPDSLILSWDQIAFPGGRMRSSIVYWTKAFRGLQGQHIRIQSLCLPLLNPLLFQRALPQKELHFRGCKTDPDSFPDVHSLSVAILHRPHPQCFPYLPLSIPIASGTAQVLTASRESFPLNIMPVLILYIQPPLHEAQVPASAPYLPKHFCWSASQPPSLIMALEPLVTSLSDKHAPSKSKHHPS